MKRILVFGLSSLFLCIIVSCGTTKSVNIGPTDVHSNTLVGIWSKPVTIDSAKLFNEFGNYSNGQEVANKVKSERIEIATEDDLYQQGGSQGGNTKKRFLVEAYLMNGRVILAFVKPKIMMEIMQLDWQVDPNNSHILPGYLFTADQLKEYSFQTIKDIDTSKDYEEDQKELLKRYHNREKYELLSRFPIGKQWGLLNLTNGTVVPLKPGTRVSTGAPGGNLNRNPI